jgi:hypothetical protein
LNIACLDHGLHVLKPRSFPPNLAPKLRERQQLFLDWITTCEQRIPTSRNPNQNRAALWRIFSSNKSAPANRKTGFYETVIQTSRRLDSFFRALKSFQIFNSEIKKSKHYCG